MPCLNYLQTNSLFLYLDDHDIISTKKVMEKSFKLNGLAYEKKTSQSY